MEKLMPSQESLQEDSCVVLTKEHIEIMEHTRDRAAHGLYCGDSKAMRELVAAGLMCEAGRKSFVPDSYFRLTGKGSEALRQNKKLKSK